MIREHPRFQKTAIIFISAIHLTDVDRLRGYEMGAVDYVPVPVVPEVLRAKVRVFAELYRKTRQLERLNAELERRVAERTAELEASNARLRESEQRRSLALAAGQMGSWDWDLVTGECQWDDGQYRIFGVDPRRVRAHARERPAADPSGGLGAHREDRRARARARATPSRPSSRIVRPDGEMRWCIGAAAMTSTRRAASCASAASPSTSPSARRPRSAGPAGARGRSSRPQRARARAIDRAPDQGEVDRGLRRGGRGAHRGAVERAYACCRSRAGRAPTSIAWSTRSWRPTAAATSSGSPLPGRPCSCSRRPRRSSRWRCTSSRPTPPNTARCPTQPAR